MYMYIVHVHSCIVQCMYTMYIHVHCMHIMYVHVHVCLNACVLGNIHVCFPSFWLF